MGTLKCALENGADLYVNERQKIRHYRARSTEERRRKKNVKDTCRPSISIEFPYCYFNLFVLFGPSWCYYYCYYLLVV